MTGRKDCTCPRARHQHGSRGAYMRDRCRCFACRMANHYALASYRDGENWRETDGQLVDRVGMRLRLQALAAIGYTARQLADYTNLTVSHLQNLRTDSAHGRVSADTFRAVVEVYDKFWDKPPTGADADRQRSRARFYGYKLPMELDDDAIDDPQIKRTRDNTHTLLHGISPRQRDEIAVAEVIAGRKVPLNKAEVSDAVRTMTDMNLSTREIADRLGVSGRQVTRLRAQIRKQEAA